MSRFKTRKKQIKLLKDREKHIANIEGKKNRKIKDGYTDIRKEKGEWI
jgi:hypothetical protein